MPKKRIVRTRRRPVRKTMRRRPFRKRGPYSDPSARETFYPFVRYKDVLPPRYFCCPRMSSIFQIAGGGTSGNGFCITANDVYAPLTSRSTYGAAGWTLNSNQTQPMGVFVMLNSNCYHNFRVHAVTIKVTGVVLSVGDQYDLVVAPIPINGTIPGATTTWMEQASRATVKTIMYGQPVRDNTIRKHYSISSMEQINRIQYIGTTGYYGSYNASPANLVSFWLQYRTLDAANNAQAVMLKVELQFFVELFRQDPYQMTEE